MVCYCGDLGRNLKNRRHPYASMSQRILAKSHLKHIANKYDFHWGGRVSDDETPKRYETVFRSYIIQPSLVNKFVNAITTQHNVLPTNELREYQRKS